LRPPVSASKRCIHPLFRFYSTKIFQEDTSENPNPPLNTYKPNNSEDHVVRDLCPKNRNIDPLAKMPGDHQLTLWKNRITSCLVDHQLAPDALASEAINAINSWSIFRVEINITVFNLVVDASMAPDTITATRVSVFMCSPPRPCYNTMVRPDVIDSVDATPIHHWIHPLVHLTDVQLQG
jgi:hypothetical protein